VLEVRILGPLEIRDDGKPVVVARSSALFTLLNSVRRRGGLERSPDRGALGGSAGARPGRLRNAPAGYLLELDRDRIDPGRFERLVEDARAGRRLDLASGGSVVAVLA